VIEVLRLSKASPMTSQLVADGGAIYKFTPTGARTTFANVQLGANGLAFDSRGNLFVADGGFAYDLVFGAAVYKFTPSGLRSTVASENDQVRVIPDGLAIDSADNLFVADGVSGSILKFTPSGVRTTFATRFVTAMAFQPNATATDFNKDGHPDYLLFNPSTRQTTIWYLSEVTHTASANGPIIPSAWEIVATGDFNKDGKPDWVLYNPSTRQSVIWYLSGTTRIGGAIGPTITAGYNLAGAEDFNGDGKPDYVLYNSSTHQTAIWYMNNYVRVGAAYGPTLPGGWSLVAP
jgi:SMP-30/gluconolaconase/LRE-like protein/VCBS repeat protein